MSIFDRYAPFVQDFIYDHQWENLRSIQVAAGDAIFNTDENVLLTASTASGKTEAAFFPILSLFWEDPPTSIGAIYVGPLKALINDQFLRLNDLCEEAEIPVWHWHGDVAASHKRKLLEHPSGILQITPESLEALLMHKHMAVPRLFHDLRFVVIDEVHSLLRGDRGGQTLCLIERLSRMAGVNPRRIGLSATIGDPERTGAFLASGTGRGCIIPRFEEPRRVWRLSMEHFYITGPQAAERAAERGHGHRSRRWLDRGEVLSVEPSSSDLALARSGASYAHLNASEDEHAQSTPEDKRAAVGATRMDTEVRTQKPSSSHPPTARRRTPIPASVTSSSAHAGASASSSPTRARKPRPCARCSAAIARPITSRTGSSSTTATSRRASARAPRTSCATTSGSTRP